MDTAGLHYCIHAVKLNYSPAIAARGVRAKEAAAVAATFITVLFSLVVLGSAKSRGSKAALRLCTAGTLCFEGANATAEEKSAALRIVDTAFIVLFELYDFNCCLCSVVVFVNLSRSTHRRRDVALFGCRRVFKKR